MKEDVCALPNRKDDSKKMTRPVLDLEEAGAHWSCDPSIISPELYEALELENIGPSN